MAHQVSALRHVLTTFYKMRYWALKSLCAPSLLHNAIALHSRVNNVTWPNIANKVS